MAKFSTVTADFIAGCRAVGMDFWADSPVTGTVWAVCEDQRFHLVRVNRKEHMAEHVCGRSLEKNGMARTNCPGSFTAKPFPNLVACAQLTGLSVLELAAATTFSAQDAVDLFTAHLDSE